MITNERLKNIFDSDSDAFAYVYHVNKPVTVTQACKKLNKNLYSWFDSRVHEKLRSEDVDKG